MRRKRQTSPGLPDNLVTFEPAAWLRPDEDPTDPIAVHYRAYWRWADAVSEATGLDRPEVSDLFPQRITWGPIRGCGCSCTHCAERSGPPGHTTHDRSTRHTANERPLRSPEIPSTHEHTARTTEEVEVPHIPFSA